MKMILFALIIFATILQYVQCGTTFFFEGNSWKKKPYPKGTSINHVDDQGGGGVLEIST